MKVAKVRLGLSMLLALVSVSTGAKAATDLSQYKHVDNEYKFWNPRSSVFFSPRWANNELTPDQYAKAVRDFEANGIAWHYPKDGKAGGTFSSALIDILRAPEYGITKFNCAMPSTTKLLSSACIDANGNPVTAPNSVITFFPNTDPESTFRAEVTDFLVKAKAAHCSSFQQDNPQMMLSRQSIGCMSNLSQQVVQEKVFRYYEWLGGEIVRVFGKTMPMSYNKGIRDDGLDAETSYNKLAPYFNSVMAETAANRNTVSDLYRVIEEVNNRGLNLTTSTVLVSRDKVEHQRHIAMSYALGANPVAPFDVFIGVDEPRFFGEAADYTDLFRMVTKNRALFDGIGTIKDIYIEQGAASPTAFSKLGKIWQARPSDRPNMAAILRTNDTARILHVLNNQSDARFFTVYLDVSLFTKVPTKARAVSPANPTPKNLTVTLEASSNRIKITTPTFQSWVVIELLN